MGHNQHGHIRVGYKIVLEPLDRLHVQVIRRLVQQQNVSTNQHGSSELQLHLPTTTQTTHRRLLLLVIKADRAKSLSDIFLALMA